MTEASKKHTISPQEIEAQLRAQRPSWATPEAMAALRDFGKPPPCEDSPPEAPEPPPEAPAPSRQKRQSGQRARLLKMRAENPSWEELDGQALVRQVTAAWERGEYKRYKVPDPRTILRAWDRMEDA